MASDASLAHLRARLEVLEARVVDAIERRRARRPAPSDEGRIPGVFLSDAEIDDLILSGPFVARAGGDDAASALDGTQLLAQVESTVDAFEAEGETTRLRQLQHHFGLSSLEIELLVIAVAPDLDPRFERFYAYLHDDLTRRRPTVGLALELAGVDVMDAGSRHAMTPTAPLAEFGLLACEGDDRPFLSRTLRVPDRVSAHLLGDDSPDAALVPYLVPTVPLASEASDELLAGLQSGARFFYVQERPGASGNGAFGAALEASGLNVVELDASSVSASDLASLVPSVLREVGLTQSGLVIDGADRLADLDRATFRRLAEAPAIVCFVGTRSWDPDWARVVPYFVDARPPPLQERETLWEVLAGEDVLLDRPHGLRSLTTLRLRPRQMMHVAELARRRAAAEGRAMAVSDLEAGARQMNSVALDQLSTRVTPIATWADLVVKPAVVHAIRSVAQRARDRELVQDVWGFGQGSRRRGTIALFSGPPGTGKTLAAEVISGELGVDLFVVNLATVVDKYIGETEKNLERIFSAAEAVNGLLFFDEADALFGKRSEVRDARDRYANIEVAYLLQRLERFDGVAVLATNLSSNVDEAFARRLDVTAEFKLPEFEERRAIWRASLPSSAPLGADIDLDYLARSFELSGGSIRNICVSAAYMAAEDGSPCLRMRDLVRSTVLEHRKLGHLIVESEFGEHYASALDGLAL
jgi:hypothetical protein